MAAHSYTATVESHGILRLHEDAAEQLELTPGDIVEVEIRRGPAAPTPDATNAILEMVGMFNGGRRDGSTNHDRFLYGTEED